MGMVTSLTRATREQLDQLIVDPEELDEFLEQPERLDPPPGYLDKSIEQIQLALDASGVRAELAPLNMPGEVFFHRGDSYFAIYPEMLQTLADALASAPREAVAQHCDEDDRDYVLHHYDNLVRFVDHASKSHLGALMSYT